MRKLLLGTANNITENINKVKLWHNSFKKVCDGDVMLIVPGLTDEDIKLLGNIPHTGVKPPEGETVNNDRLIHQEQYLKLHLNNYDVVLVTDVFDVAFLKDPFTKMDFNNYNIFVGGEGVLHREEPWNSDVMNKCFPNYFSLTKNQEVFCSGVIGGNPRALVNWFREMDKICLDSLKGHDIEDQAAMNIVIYNYKDTKLKTFKITDRWCLHMAIGGPTDLFEAWGFKSILKNRFGITPNWKDYDIVHQFNRIPEIHKQIKELCTTK
jgi:hypothetical protein